MNTHRPRLAVSMVRTTTACVSFANWVLLLVALPHALGAIKPIWDPYIVRIDYQSLQFPEDQRPSVKSLKRTKIVLKLTTRPSRTGVCQSKPTSCDVLSLFRSPPLTAISVWLSFG